jgi:DNA-3-methyladenine glycosylase II
VDVECRGPFDLSLSLRAMRSFGRTVAETAMVRSGATPDDLVLRLGVRVAHVPTLLEIRQAGLSPAVVRAEARPAPASRAALRTLAARIVNADLDLTPFYERAAGHPVFGPLTRSLHGLKGFRPASLFDMLVTAVIEQQISLIAARHIRARLVARFGAEVEGEPVFPAPQTIAAATLEDLTACGLSRRKAEYAAGVAASIVDGALDLDALETAPDGQVRERIVALRGFGPWSADYVLVRGLARPDAVPYDDLGIRSVVGVLLGDGIRPSAEETAALLAPLAPYRGLAAFYLLVASRLM